MNITEAEAATKWCPHVRHADENTGSYNRWNAWVDDPKAVPNPQKGMTRPKIDSGVLGAECTCIASRCMMWRWIHKHDHATGHCGLAND